MWLKTKWHTDFSARVGQSLPGLNNRYQNCTISQRGLGNRYQGWKNALSGLDNRYQGWKIVTRAG